jgi:hypothetical protein
MTTAARTDIHSPGSPEFNPQAYRLIDCYDLHIESGDQRYLNEALTELEKAGYVLGGNTRAACGHCGQTNLRYVALLAHDGAKEYIFVGQDCLAGRFVSQTKASFTALRKAAELERAKQKNLAAWLKLCEANPCLVQARDLTTDRDAATVELHERAGCTWAISTLADIAAKARRYGEASDKQIAFVERLLAEVDEKIRAQVAKDAEPVVEVPPAPEGKVTVEGEIVYTRWQDSDYGTGCTKMLVVTDAGWKVWATMPQALALASAPVFNAAGDEVGSAAAAGKGDRVRFTATLTRSDDDPAFALAKRPTKAEIVAKKD